MKNRVLLIFGFFILLIVLIAIIASAVKSTVSSLSTKQTTASDQGGESSTVPWDYQLKEAKVGDLIGEDMVLLPDNERISNDQNFATGDPVWVVNYMSATMQTNEQGQNDVTLSAWKPIKTYKTKDEAEKDLAELKKEIKTDVKLVGEYKTDYEGKSRYFAVIEMPTGQTVKQPIPETRYAAFKNKDQVSVVLEEVHDYADYDISMAKFRGWVQ
ncbi:hypothetical protein [Paenibacillus athensensis]|uniref:hypothetical protein n=1 Tax=Paenibacillus athensensis TaxID=1967502 RepID=UPI001E4CEB57|nr:hypothetical protein [Paenibacillus athensensis]